MPEISEARKRANKKWNDKHLATKYDHIHLALPVGYRDKVRTAAQGSGEKVNEYIRKAIDQRIENDRA